MDHKNEVRKVMLMHLLGIPDDSIEGLKNGTLELNDVLKARIVEITSDPDNYSQAGIVCQNIRFENVTWETLDPEEHLAHISEMMHRNPDAGFGSQSVRQRTDSTADSSDTQDSTQKQPGTDTGGASDTRQAQGSAPPGAGSTEQHFGSTEQRFTDAAGQRTDRSGNTGGPAGPGGPRNIFNRPVDPRSICRHPWPRFFARIFDLALCVLFVELIHRFIGGRQAGVLFTTTSVSVLSMGGIFMTLIEPLFLITLGTTPGKFIWGLKVTSTENRRLNVREAYFRSIGVYIAGLGFLFPIFYIYRLIRSIIKCNRREQLFWDRGCVIEYRPDRKAWRIAGYVAMCIVLLFTEIATAALAELPSARGRITEDEFYKNLSEYVTYNNLTLSDDITVDCKVEGGYVTAVTMTIAKGNVPEAAFKNNADKGGSVLGEILQLYGYGSSDGTASNAGSGYSNLMSLYGLSAAAPGSLYGYYTEEVAIFTSFAAIGRSGSLAGIIFGTSQPSYLGSLSDFSYEYGDYLITNSVRYYGYSRSFLTQTLTPDSAPEDERYFVQTYTISLKH